MTTLVDLPAVETPTGEAVSVPRTYPRAGAGALGVVVVGMIVAAVYTRGGFFPRDAFGVAAVSAAIVGLVALRHRDGTGAAVTLAAVAFVAWWLFRATAVSGPAAFLPLGGSVLGFLAAFLVVRGLDDRQRAYLAGAVVAVGAVAAASGVAGVLRQWHRLAQVTGGTWRVSTTLTYPDAAAALFVVTLLVALARPGTSLCSRLGSRLAVCLCTTALFGTQSRWDLLALAAGALVVPWRRWLDMAWPLAAGSLAGLMVVGSSNGPRPEWTVVAAATGTMLCAALRAPAPLRHRSRFPAGAVCILLIPLVAVTLLVLPGPLAALNQVDHRGQSQTVAWSASATQWRSAEVEGVGPPRIYDTAGPVATYPAFEPDTYLTVAADGGLVGVGLLLLLVVAVAAAVRRRDPVSSAAAAALVGFAVAGGVDFDWQLPALALVGGCVAGLASAPPRPAAASSRRRLRRGRGVPWAAAIAVVVAAQLTVGTTLDTRGIRTTTSVADVAPLAAANPSAPAQFILQGYDPTDPFMLHSGGLYYLYTSQGTNLQNMPLWIGTEPGHWDQNVDALPHLPAWAKAGATWAPDVRQVAGGWALYFSALVRSVTPPTHCVGAAFADTPRGPFVPMQQPFICQLDHRGTIDARTFLDNGNQLVMLFKSEDNANPSWPGPDQNGYTGIYAQRLSADGRQLLGSAVKIFSPDQPWEGTIVESPDMVEAWGTYWLFFSGNWYNQPAYGIGVASCQSAFGPCTDVQPAPFLGSNLQGSGPGEESVFQDGRNFYLLYNPFHANDPGPVTPRPVAMARVGFRPQGPYLAAFGQP